MIDTQSDESSSAVPSTPGQMKFAEVLAEELRGIGISDVRLDEMGYLYGSLPATADDKAPVIGFIAHLDTAEACPPPSKMPKRIRNYDGNVIILDSGIALDPEEDDKLRACKGEELLVTDGWTLLGGDDKAGVAAIVSALEYLAEHPEMPHGKIVFAFTPDEEIGTSQNHFDTEAFGADFAYTVDGGPFGEIEYENFNAAMAVVEVKGINAHPGEAKNKMKNAIQIAMEFHQMLPAWERPEHTEGYEGFYHLGKMEGECENTKLYYLVREHDMEKYLARQQFLHNIAKLLNEKYGEGTVRVEITHSYSNMAETVKPHMHLIECARQAIRELETEPVTQPIRGGTDGCQLSFKGIPCPNLGTGSFNHHSVRETVSIDQMEKSMQLIVKLALAYGKGEV